MDKETALELVADRYGSVDWELVKEASWWLIDNGYAEELRKVVYETEPNGSLFHSELDEVDDLSHMEEK